MASSSDHPPRKTTGPKALPEKQCVVCSVVFLPVSKIQKKCPQHRNLIQRLCEVCNQSFWAARGRNPRNRNGKLHWYCGPVCRDKMKPAIKLPTGRPQEPKLKSYCAVCNVELPRAKAIQKYCSKHRYYTKANCGYCRKSFPTPKANPQRHCSESCRLNSLKRCAICGVEFEPMKLGSIYCPTHAAKGPEGNRAHLHWKHGAPPSVGNPKNNPHKIGIIKDCESRKHTECSGKMMVFANQWTECTHCARMVDKSIQKNV